MTTYQEAWDPILNKVRTDTIIKDGVIWVPNHLGNRDWQEYQAWLEEGNKPEPPEMAESLGSKKVTE